MRKLRNTIPWNAACAVLLLCFATTPSSAQTFTTIANFGAPQTGSEPDYGPLAQGLDGNFYGATTAGGVGGRGTTYKMTPTGRLTRLDRFGGDHGSAPYGGLIQATNGNLYGTTSDGGPDRAGTLFKMTIDGALNTLRSFNGTDGETPYATLIQAVNGNFYGTTVEGGASSGCNGYACGTIFEITPSGTLTTLYSFCSQSNCTDGAEPFAGLVQAANGTFYGTTTAGGAFASECGGQGCGTVFKITPSGELATLYSFCSQTNCTDGKNPDAALLQAEDGNFYGTTSGGGLGGGTIFKITPSGTLTTLYNFCSQSNCTDGYTPYAALIQATDGNFYGTTYLGGGGGNCFYGCGTVFKITAGGALTTLHSFSGPDGEGLDAGLVQATNGKLYGTTSGGGTKITGTGTAFSLSMGLGPFVETLIGSGKVGATVIILGTKLTGTTAVSFNGTAAAFTVVSETEITTTVPSGATTGFVTVTTPSGKLKSNKKFRITG
ncbi:MAG: choice-of-anchor tandem repeat GloVer-containing protein [Terriglobales bacterium]|jgi:uncharacterized repeat protein (TIGR03803 family)